MSKRSERRAEAQLARPASLAACLFVLLTAGCAGVEPATQSELPQVGATPEAERSLPSAPPQTGTTQAPAAAAAGKPGSPAATLPPPQPAGQRVAKTDSPAAKISAKSPASNVPIEHPAKKESSAPATAKPPASPPLDLASLENRLKETKAIGLFTKIALKNQVDDLLNQFRAYYQGSVKTTLAQLRQRYDLLLLKVLSLLQDSDQSLATAISASREAIWGILADRQKFATI